MQAIFFIEFFVLQRINDIKSSHPCQNTSREQDGKRMKMPGHRKVSSQGCKRKSETEDEMTKGSKALRKRINQHHGKCHRGEEEANGIDKISSGNEKHGRKNNQCQRSTGWNNSGRYF